MKFGKKEKVAKEYILRYLDQHPYPGDTLSGITKYWLEQTRIEIAVDEVAQALAELVKEGKVVKCELGGETFFWKSLAEKDATI